MSFLKQDLRIVEKYKYDQRTQDLRLQLYDRVNKQIIGVIICALFVTLYSLQERHSIHVQHLLLE